MKEMVVWPCMMRDINNWVRDCARAKEMMQPAAAIQLMAVTRQRFSHIHLDLVGPLPTSLEGFRYLFTIIDRTSRWLVAVPLPLVEAEQCVDALVGQWITRFGSPDTITSDQGAQFTSSLWAKTCR